MPGGEVSWPVDGGRDMLRVVEELLVELGVAPPARTCRASTSTQGAARARLFAHLVLLTGPGDEAPGSARSTGRGGGPVDIDHGHQRSGW